MSTFEDTTKAVLQPRNPGEELKVKETVLKRKDRNLKANAARAAKIAEERRKKQDRHKVEKLVTPARLIKDALVRKNDSKRLKRVGKGKKIQVKETSSKCLIAVRNHRKKPTKVVSEMLEKLKLTKISTLVFLAHTEEVLRDLKVVEPFVYWGMPSFKIVNDILHKKAHFKTNAEEKHILSSNALLEEHLGDMGILCVEDLVSVISQREDSFEKVTERLWPVELGDFTEKKAEGFKVDGKLHLFGHKGTQISKIVAAIL